MSFNEYLVVYFKIYSYPHTRVVATAVTSNVRQALSPKSKSQLGLKITSFTNLYKLGLQYYLDMFKKIITDSQASSNVKAQ